jgi:hypothetical protein
MSLPRQLIKFSEQLGFGEDTTRSRRGNYLVLGESPIIEASSFDAPRQQLATTGRRVPQSNHDMALAGCESHGTAARVRFSIRLAVAIQLNSTIGGVNSREMNGTALGVLFVRRTLDGLRTLEVVAAGQPTFGLALAKDDGVKRLSIERLDAKYCAAALLGVG